MDRVNNVLVQLGEPLDFIDAGAGLIATSDGLDTLLTATTATNNINRCALSRPLSGSWMVQVLIDSMGRVSPDNFYVGVIADGARRVLSRQRPSGREVLTGRNLKIGWDGVIAINANANVYRDGALVTTMGAAATVGDSIFILYDADARTLTLRVNDPSAGGVVLPNVYGPLTVAAVTQSSTVILRFIHDIERLPRVPRHRPAGVWGRLATIGVMDHVTGAVWDGRIALGDTPEFEQSLGFPILGSRGGSGVGDIVAINTPAIEGDDSGALDDWLTWHVRDEPFSILMGDAAEAVGLATVQATGVVDSVSAPREARLAVSTRDPSVLLDVPWQADTYSDGAITVAAVIGKAKPTVTGTCRALPLIPVERGWAGGHVSDDALVSIDAVYDRGVKLTLGTGYAVTASRTGVARLTNPDGLQCVDAVGGVLDTLVCIDFTQGDFAGSTWAGSPAAPPGWTNQSTLSGQVVKQSTGARFVRGTTGFADLFIAGVLGTTAGLARIDLDVPVYDSGELRIEALTTGGTPTLLATVPQPHPGLHQHSFYVNIPGARPNLRLRVSENNTGINIRSLRIARVKPVSTLADHVRYAATYRGALATVGASLAAFSGPLASAPLCHATGLGERTTVRATIEALCASAFVSAYFSLTGNLEIAAWKDPDTLSPIATIDDTNIISDVRVTLDRAPGLSYSASGNPTWAVHGQQDIAGSLYTTEPGRVLAGALMADYATTATVATPLAHVYEFARSAEPIETLLSSPTDVQHFADTLAVLYRQQRHMYQLSAFLDSTPVPGTAVSLTHGGITRSLLVLGVRGRFADGITQLTLWG